MPLTRSLEQLHRQLTDLWADTSERPCVLTHSEYGYLRAIERLDGEQLARSADEIVPKAGQDTQSGMTRRGKLNDKGHHLQDLVELLKVRKASASVAIAKLEKRGFIHRFACQYDARAQHIVLTDKGTESLRGEEVIYDAAAEQIKNLLTSEELSTLQSCLTKIGKAF